MAGFVLLVIVAIPAYGYYATFVAPPRRMVAEVNGITYTRGDMVKIVTVIATSRIRLGLDPQMAGLPFEVLTDIVENELVRQGAPSLGITVTQGDIDAQLRENFTPRPGEGEETDPEQQERDFQESLRDYLTFSQISEKEYREFLRRILLRRKARDQVSDRVPITEEQVYVHWIVTGDELQMEEALVRLEAGEAFESVARSLNQETTFADANGDVGWIPRGAFPDLDSWIFDRELNVVEGPLATADGQFLFKVTAGPETRPVAQEMLGPLQEQALQQWLNAQYDTNDIEVKFGSSEYDWVLNQVQKRVQAAQPETTQPQTTQ